MKKIASIVLFLLVVSGVTFYLILAQNASPFIRAGIFGVICCISLVLCKIHKNRKLTKCILVVLFVVYLHLLLSMLFFDSYFGRTSTYSSINLIPFKTICGYFNADLYSFAVNIIGNLVAFSPFGFFLPVLFKAQRKFGLFMLTVLAIIVIVEVFQFVLGCGACDIDDLILNLAGACMAYMLIKNKIAT